MKEYPSLRIWLYILALITMSLIFIKTCSEKRHNKNVEKEDFLPDYNFDEQRKQTEKYRDIMYPDSETSTEPAKDTLEKTVN